METFNICFAFGNADVIYTVVCASETTIDRELVFETIRETFIEHDNTSISPERLIRYVVDNIRSDCDCNAVFIRSDLNFSIPYKN